MSGYQLDVGHKGIILDKMSFLKQHISVSGTGLLDHLLSTGVLHDQEVEEIKFKSMEYDKVDQLLHYMMRTSEEQYQLFLDSLNQADNQHVYNQLNGTHHFILFYM